MKRRKFLEILGISTLLPAVGITLDAVSAELPVDTTWWAELHTQLQRAILVDGRPTYEHFEAVALLKRQKRYAEAETLLLRIMTAEKAVARIGFQVRDALERTKSDPTLLRSLRVYRDTHRDSDGQPAHVYANPISRTGTPGVWLQLAVLYSKQSLFGKERSILEQYIRLDADHRDTMQTRMDGITSRKIYTRYEKLMQKRFPGDMVLGDEKIRQCYV